MVQHLGQCTINKWKLLQLLMFIFAPTSPYMELEKKYSPMFKCQVSK